ncbi:MAG: helix-turn-helix domain-containing protein, partial [Paracoccaceae bacterium]
MTSNTTMSSQSEMIPLVPDWVPEAARTYLAHTETGFGMRELARRHALHASTVLRHVRRFENRRDDPLVDEALAALGGAITPKDSPQDGFQMNEFSHVARVALDDEIETEARRILRRLCEAAAFLIVVPS